MGFYVCKDLKFPDEKLEGREIKTIFQDFDVAVDEY